VENNKERWQADRHQDMRLDSSVLRAIPLGGLGEIGKNMMMLEYETDKTHDSIIIDTGIMFPENDMLGIDYIIPDFQYIMDRLETIRGVIITHGHEDHTGAIGHVMEHVPAPVYATPLTRGLLEVKLRSAGLIDRTTLATVQAGDTVRMGPFLVEFFHVCHSIPDSVGLGIVTPLGLVVHTGDYKFDHTPVDGWPTDFAKLAEFSGRNVLALFADSTNADVPGWTKSEAIIEPAFDQVFRTAKGRIIVATFASLISRVQQVVNVSRRHGRKIAFAGYSMVENVKMARKLGYLDFDDEMIVDLNNIASVVPERLVIMGTGAQGEPGAVLGRLAAGRHRQIEIEQGDTVILSSHPIPGNEEMVHRTINKLIQRGAEVVYDPVVPVHVSGHASQEEMKLMINLVRPKYFIPVHGELRHLHLHKRMAIAQGIQPDNAVVIENGVILNFTAKGMEVGERIPGGYVYVDGSGVGDVGPAVMRDREILGRDGFVIVNMMVDGDTHELVSEPEILSRGFVYLKESADLMSGATRQIENAIDNLSTPSNGNGNGASMRRMREEIEKQLDRYFYNETKRRPMIFTFVNEV
jgi:ribonuclease J